MPTYPPPGDCVHCGCVHNALTWDHVFPKAWYPDTTPPNLEKWQIPSCKPCNQEYGKIEDDMLLRIGLCLDPADPKSSGIVDKVLRALNPDFARSPKDRQHRLARRKKILLESFTINEMPSDSFFPHFDKPDGLWTEPPVGVRLNADHIKMLTTKIVKGMTYIEDGFIIKEPYRVATFVLRDPDAATIIALLAKSGTTYAREPGIVVIKASAFDDRSTAIYSIEIWGRLKIYAMVTDQDHPELVDNR